jgi:hypothetical protein
MNVYPNISYIAKLIAEPTRAIILDCLMNNQALPASELAYMAKVSHPSSLLAIYSPLYYFLHYSGCTSSLILLSDPSSL